MVSVYPEAHGLEPLPTTFMLSCGEISQALQEVTKCLMDGGTSPSAQDMWGLGGTDFTENSCRWPWLHEYLFEKNR